jgi:Ser/Thr protein kinase RdoA (MazF antagonist)
MDEYSLLIKTLKSWGLPNVTSIKKIYYTGAVFSVATSKGAKYILKEKKNLDKADAESKLLISLKSYGLPIGVPLSNKKNTPYIIYENKNYILYPYLPGFSITNYYTESGKEHSKAFGKAISMLHSGLLKCTELNNLFPKMDLHKEIYTIAIPKIKQNSDESEKKYLDTIANEISDYLSNTYTKLPLQLIHKDAHPSNILFHDGKLSGFIDFESVELGSRIFDVCYCSTYILIKGFRDPEKRLSWLTLSKSLFEGYEKINPLSKEEKEAIRYLLIAILIFFTAVFYSVNNTETAAKTKQAIFWAYENMMSIEGHKLIP